MKRESFLLGGAGMVLAGCSGSVASLATNPTPAPLKGSYVTPYVGQLLLVPYTFAPDRWSSCDGSEDWKVRYPELYSVIGTRFGGNEKEFAVPDLRGRTPVDGLQYVIALKGQMPDGDTTWQYLGELMLVAFDTVPKGWALADGSSRRIRDFPELFSLIGNAFGGDMTNFKLPDLRGREPAKGLTYVISMRGTYPSRAFRERPQRVEEDIDAFVGQLSLMPYSFAPYGWLPTDGQMLDAHSKDDIALYALLGDRFGGKFPEFAVPDLRKHEPLAGLHYFIANDRAIFPPRP